MKCRLGSTVFAVLFIAACAGTQDGGPDARFATVDEFLTGVCGLAALCPGTSSTPAEINACPLGIQTELSPTQETEIARVTAYARNRQDCIPACVGSAICGRFGGSVANISDSDIMEPYRTCEQQCP